MAATTISRTVWTDGASGTIIDNAEKNSAIYDPIDALFTSSFTFGDLVNAEGFGTHSWSAGGTGGNIFNLVNTTAGTGNYSAIHLGRDGDTDAGRVEAYSSSSTIAAPAAASGVAVRSMGSGGLSLAAEDASGDVRLYANGTTKIATFGGDDVALSGGTPGAHALSGVLDDSVNTSQVGTDADTSEKTLATYTLPASSLSATGHAIRATWTGTFAANANSKTVSVKFGATTVASGAHSVTSQDRFIAQLLVIRTGAATQKCIASIRTGRNDAISAVNHEVMDYQTAAETMSGTIAVALTAENGTAQANETVHEFSYVEIMR